MGDADPDGGANGERAVGVNVTPFETKIADARVDVRLGFRVHYIGGRGEGVAGRVAPVLVRSLDGADRCDRGGFPGPIQMTPRTEIASRSTQVFRRNSRSEERLRGMVSLGVRMAYNNGTPCGCA